MSRASQPIAQHIDVAYNGARPRRIKTRTCCERWRKILALSVIYRFSFEAMEPRRVASLGNVVFYGHGTKAPWLGCSAGNPGGRSFNFTYIGRPLTDTTVRATVRLPQISDWPIMSHDTDWRTPPLSPPLRLKRGRKEASSGGYPLKPLAKGLCPSALPSQEGAGNLGFLPGVGGCPPALSSPPPSPAGEGGRGMRYQTTPLDNSQWSPGDRGPGSTRRVKLAKAESLFWGRLLFC